jgi:hypothetical protein
LPELTPLRREALRSAIADKCIEVEDLFNKPMKVTCIVRDPDNDRSDVLVSNDTTEGIEAVLARTKAGMNT